MHNRFFHPQKNYNVFTYQAHHGIVIENAKTENKAVKAKPENIRKRNDFVFQKQSSRKFLLSLPLWCSFPKDSCSLSFDCIK